MRGRFVRSEFENVWVSTDTILEQLRLECCNSVAIRDEYEVISCGTGGECLADTGCTIDKDLRTFDLLIFGDSFEI